MPAQTDDEMDAESDQDEGNDERRRDDQERDHPPLGPRNLSWSGDALTRHGHERLAQGYAEPATLAEGFAGHPQDIVQRVPVAVQVEHRGPA